MKRLGNILSVVLLASVMLVQLVRAEESELSSLVLSEIEERIAGKLAFYSLKRHLTEAGIDVRQDDTLTRIGTTIAKYSDRPQLNYAFYLIDGDIEPQALSLPGGYVLLTKNLLELVCRSEDDIAFILGHEIAHSALRHYADYQLQDGQQVAYVRQLLQTREPENVEQYNAQANDVQRILLPYIINVRQVKEMEADQFGALYALRSGYEYSASMKVLNRLRELFGEKFDLEKDPTKTTVEPSVEGSTHPALSTRLEQLELFRLKAVEVSKLFPTGRKALDDGNYEEAALIFESLLSLFPQSRTARIGLGVARHLKYWDSSSRNDFLLAYPGMLEIEQLQLLRGQPDYQTLQQAIDAYREVLSHEPGNKYAANNLGVAFAELRQFDEAEQTLREAVRLDAQDFILFNLALVLYEQYHQTQQPEKKREALEFLRQYLADAPSDQIAIEYLQKFEQGK